MIGHKWCKCISTVASHTSRPCAFFLQFTAWIYSKGRSNWAVGREFLEPREVELLRSLERWGQNSWLWLLWPGNPCLCRVCGFLSLEVISTGLFYVGTPVCSRARDPWQELALACVQHGDRFLLETSSWLFCEMCTCAFGMRLVYYCMPLQCIFKNFYLAMSYWKSWGFWLLKAQVNMAYRWLPAKSPLEGTYRHRA